jgi:hypothetical protein
MRSVAHKPGANRGAKTKWKSRKGNCVPAAKANSSRLQSPEAGPQAGPGVARRLARPHARAGARQFQDKDGKDPCGAGKAAPTWVYRPEVDGRLHGISCPNLHLGLAAESPRFRSFLEAIRPCEGLLAGGRALGNLAHMGLAAQEVAFAAPEVHQEGRC